MVHEVYDLAEARHSPHVARKRQARIREILRIALEIVTAEGRDALTLKRLAERQGVTSAALYRYFPSKDALVAELQRAIISALAETTRARVGLAEDHARRIRLSEQERALLDVTVSAFVFEEFSRSSPVEFGILSTDLSAPEYTLSDHEAARVFEMAWSALSDLASRLRIAQDCGALGPGDESGRAVTIWASLQGVVQTRKLARHATARIDSTRIARGLLATLLVGWGARARAVDRVVELALSEAFAASPESALDSLLTSDE